MILNGIVLELNVVVYIVIFNILNVIFILIIGIWKE